MSSPIVSDPLVYSSGLGSPDYRTVSWPAIFAGMTAAVSLQVLFVLLGAGFGLALFSPITDENPVAEFGKGAVIIHGISAVVSLWFGGWVAGRFTPVRVNNTGWLHGFSVWAASTVAAILIVATGAGWAVGGLSKMVGGGLSMAGKPASAMAGGVADVAKDALKQTTDTLSSFTDESLARLPANSGRDVGIRAKREIGFAVAKLFNPREQANVNANRAAVVKVLSQQTSMSEADADRLVTEWTASYERLKAELKEAKNEAEIKAREAADRAAGTLAAVSLGTFAAFVLGALAASFGGRSGASCALRKMGVVRDVA